MEPLKAFMTGKDDRNLLKLVTPPPQTGWKSATPVSWLCSLGQLFKSYIEVAPNTVISSKRHKQALVRLEESDRVNFSKKSTSDFTDAIDDYVRMGLAHIRMLKQSAEAKERAYRRADQHQQRLLDEILELVDVKVVVEPGPTATHTGSQIVVATADYDSQPLQNSGPSCSSRIEPTPHETTTAFQGSLDFEGIFDSVLDDDVVDGVKIHFTKRTDKEKDEDKDKDKDKEKKYAILVKTPPGTPSPKKSPNKKHGTTRRNSGAFELALTEEDKKMLLEAQEASPICKGGKSQQQRLNEKRPPKKSKGKSKGKSAHDKAEPLKANKGKNNKNKATSSKKGKGTSEKGKAGASCKRPASDAVGNQTEDDPAALPIVVPDWIPDPSTLEGRRSVIRARYVSQGYHKTMVALKQQGCTNHDAMKAAARRAHKVAGETFDKAWPAAYGTQNEEETPKKTEAPKKDAPKKKKKKKNGAKTKKQNESKIEEKETETKKPETPLTRKRSKGPQNNAGKEAEGDMKNEVQRDIEDDIEGEMEKDSQNAKVSRGANRWKKPKDVDWLFGLHDKPSPSRPSPWGVYWPYSERLRDFSPTIGQPLSFGTFCGGMP